MRDLQDLKNDLRHAEAHWRSFPQTKNGGIPKMYKAMWLRSVRVDEQLRRKIIEAFRLSELEEWLNT
jgi:hypothetical protein